MAREPHARDGNWAPARDGGLHIEDPTGSPALAPFLMIPLKGVNSDWQLDRPAAEEFRTRKPDGVSWVSPNEVHVRVVNLGRVASDLVWLDWQVRFCVDPTHTPEVGFTFDHAGEQRPDEIQSIVRVTNVSAGAIYTFIVTWQAPDQLAIPVRNVYFRARISGLWSRRKPPSEWDFAHDQAVTEAHIALP